jgi:hypothetical protein
MTIMPATGIAMGYFGGNGLPFFFTTVPGIIKTEDNKKGTGEIAKQVSSEMVSFPWSHFPWHLNSRTIMAELSNPQTARYLWKVFGSIARR